MNCGICAHTGLIIAVAADALLPESAIQQQSRGHPGFGISQWRHALLRSAFSLDELIPRMIPAVLMLSTISVFYNSFAKSVCFRHLIQRHQCLVSLPIKGCTQQEWYGVHYWWYIETNSHTDIMSTATYCRAPASMYNTHWNKRALDSGWNRMCLEYRLHIVNCVAGNLIKMRIFYTHSYSSEFLRFNHRCNYSTMGNKSSPVFRWYPAKGALPAILTHGR